MIDQYNRKIEYARISLTDRCNLRCQYCMPESGVAKMPHGDILTLEETLRVAQILSTLGIKKIRLTGGEPLLRKNIIHFLKKLKNLNGIEKVMLTTNGVLLDFLAEDLISAGLDGVNLSLDTLNEENFNLITRRNLFVNVRQGLYKILQSTCEVKINCVPIKGINEDELLNIVNLAKNNDIKIRFIELMPLGCAVDFKGVPTLQVRRQIENTFGEMMPIPKKDLQGPAQYFKLQGFKGQIGFIDALEHKFCSSCNRIRLTADGFLKLCLNSNTGLDIKSLLRSGIDDFILREEIQNAIYNKPKEHHFNEYNDLNKMYQIGG